MGLTVGMRHVVILAPMPLEMDAITTAFGLSPIGDRQRDAWSGKLGESEVTAIHIGMGPPLTRKAANLVLDGPRPDPRSPTTHLAMSRSRASSLQPRA